MTNKQIIFACVNMIKIGDEFPAVTVQEFVPEPVDGCVVGVNQVDTHKALANKKVAIFALPGAFTPTCSSKHVPSYIALADEFKKAGVDEIWCLSVNDAFVMHYWGLHEKVGKSIRMIGDGSAALAMKLGLSQDLTAKGMGVRSQRYSMFVVNGKVAKLNVEAPGKFEVSDGQTLLNQIKGASL